MLQKWFIAMQVVARDAQMTSDYIFYKRLAALRRLTCYANASQFRKW